MTPGSGRGFVRARSGVETLASLRNLLLRFGVDRAVGTTVLTRVGQAIASIVLMILVATRLSSVEQGYYVTINSLVSAQVFLELGLTFVLLQFASHEVARLVRNQAGVYEGDPNSKLRLASLLHFGFKWYAFAAILLLLLVLPGGYWFFTTSYHGGQDRTWQLPWLVLVLATAVTMLTNAQIAIIEGCGQVAEVARLRLTETVAGSALAVIVLALGGGLYAAPALVVCDAIAELAWLHLRRDTILELWRSYDSRVSVHWRREIWPFQWKIAVSWLSGYFIFQVANPVLFREASPVEAGRMGLTIQACTGLTALSMAWITTKSPKMGSLISLGRRDELDALFFRAAKSAVSVAIVIALAFWAAVTLGQGAGFPIALRFTEPIAMGLMLLSAICNCVVFAQAQYLRAHKTEPFLVVSIAAAVVNISLVLLLVGPYGTLGVAVAFAFTSCVVGLGGGTYLFQKSRRDWAMSADSPALATAENPLP